MVKIRLARRGRKRMAIYDIVVADSKSPRDGKFIEKLGTFNPNVHPNKTEVSEERSLYWLLVGAQPSDTAARVLSNEGIMFKKHLQVGVNKGAVAQEVADSKFAEWKVAKEAKKVKDADARQKAIEKAKIDAKLKAKAAKEAAKKPATTESAE